jgi:hypothetical protein
MSGKTKRVTKSKFAGMVAPLVVGSGVAMREAIDMRIKVDPKDLARVDDLMSSVLGACDSVEASAKQIVSAMESSQKRLYRRVQIVVQDEEGSQLANSVFDLKEANELIARVNGTDIRASISQTATE